MASFRARSASAPERTDLYQDITDRIIIQLEQGRVPWVQPWDSAAAALDLPVNASTRARYSGINILILWSAMIERGFTTNRFLTFRQALELGGNVRKGARVRAGGVRSPRGLTAGSRQGRRRPGR